MAQLRCTNVAFCCNGCTTFSVDGANGRLLEVTDDLSCSIFSANTIAGLPVIEAFANYCVSMGQFGGHKFEVTCTSIRGGKCTTASGIYSVVAGGCCNVASGFSSFVGGGGGISFPASVGNTASGDMSAVVGGIQNCTTGACSFIGGGCRNTNSGVYSFIGGGQQNCICSNNGNTISGGAGNLINTGNYNTVGGGISNCVSNSNRATVGGGCTNTASGNYSTISGGYRNYAQAASTAVAGGYNNDVSTTSAYGFIGGGQANGIYSSKWSSIIGGFCNKIYGSALGTNNVHIIGSCIQLNPPSPNYTYVNNLCQTGGGLSDCRVKNTIQPLEFGLDHIAQLQPVSFCWNGDSSCHKKYGFIAQNVQQAMSCVVTCNKLHRLGDNGTQVLGDQGEPLLEFEKDAIYASYVNAIKELKAENDALKQRITAIENILKNNNLI